MLTSFQSRRERVPAAVRVRKSEFAFTFGSLPVDCWIGQRHDEIAVVCALKRVRETPVCGDHAGANSLGQGKVHEVGDRSVVGNGEPDRVSADGLVRVPVRRHAGHARRTGPGFGNIHFASTSLAPQSVGEFSGKQARRVQFFPRTGQLRCGIRVFFGDEPLDRDACVATKATADQCP